MNLTRLIFHLNTYFEVYRFETEQQSRYGHNSTKIMYWNILFLGIITLNMPSIPHFFKLRPEILFLSIHIYSYKGNMVRDQPNTVDDLPLLCFSYDMAHIGNYGTFIGRFLNRYYISKLLSNSKPSPWFCFYVILFRGLFQNYVMIQQLYSTSPVCTLRRREQPDKERELL